MSIRTIIDMDIGTDVDDCLALALALGSPELSIEGITCVYGDVDLRGRMVRKLLGMAHRTDIPVLLGAETSLVGRRDVYWGGHEGVGLLTADDPPVPPGPHAVDFLVSTIMGNPGQIHLLAIGPLTNVALALRREPRIAGNLAHLTIMGGLGRGAPDYRLPIAEHNFVCDPEAAHVVLSSGAPMTLIPLDVTTRVALRPADVAALRATGRPLLAAVAGQVDGYPPFREHGWTHLHDPLAAAAVVQPDLVTTIPLRVDIELGGHLTTGASLFRAPTGDLPANARVAIDVHAEAERFIILRIGRAGAIATAQSRPAGRPVPAD